MGSVFGMHYEIAFVDELPEGHDFLLVQTANEVVIAYRRSALCPRVLEDSWAAFRALSESRLLVAV